jgi:hypothetical protein
LGHGIRFLLPPFLYYPPFFVDVIHLYCISRKNVDTEYTYYSWCMTSTDIVKWRKNEWLWKFWKRNDLYENLKKGGIVEKRGEEETNSMPQVPVVISYTEIYHLTAELWFLLLLGLITDKRS